jgi:hypothetical protein
MCDQYHDIDKIMRDSGPTSGTLWQLENAPSIAMPALISPHPCCNKEPM